VLKQNKHLYIIWLYNQTLFRGHKFKFKKGEKRMGNSRLRTLLAIMVAMFVLATAFAVSADVAATLGDITVENGTSGEFVVTVPVTNGADETTILVWKDTNADAQFTAGTDTAVYVDQEKGDATNGASFTFITTEAENTTLLVRTGGIGLTATTTTMTVTPTSTVETFTVTFKDEDGITVLKTQEVESGQSATPPDVQSREGYDFAWDGDYTNVQANVTITATYTIKKFTVTFVDYDGTTELKTQVVDYNTSATAPAVPTSCRLYIYRLEW